MSKWIDADYINDFFDRWEKQVKNAEPVTIDVVQNTRAILNEAPTMEVGEWIPVSERLPEGDDDVLVTVWWGYGKPEVWAIDYAGVTRGAEEGQIVDEKILAHILAWRPLPAPYKGGDTE